MPSFKVLIVDDSIGRNRPAKDIFRFDDLEVNRVTHQVSRAGPKEYSFSTFSCAIWGTPCRAPKFSMQSGTRKMARSPTSSMFTLTICAAIDAGSERPLIRTVRGTGYQIGKNNQLG